MLVGQSAVMRELMTMIERIGRTGFTVLIEGESGVGKEEVAKEIHRASARRRGPFVAVNCAALVETLLEAELFGIEERTATGVRGRRGKFELADGGTLFLDEVGDLSATAQAKLLRVLQESTVERVGSHIVRSFDTRIVAATNRGLTEMVAHGLFRPDLFYRLSGVEVNVPPLRARREDIPLLVAHFLGLYAPDVSVRVAPAALLALVSHDWPGNVRQLARVLERAVALATTTEIGIDDLPSSVSGPRPTQTDPVAARDQSLRAWSSVYVRGVLDRCRGNKRRACDILDITYHTLQTHIAYGESLGLLPRTNSKGATAAEALSAQATAVAPSAAPP